MHEFRTAEEVVRDHPLLSSLRPFLRKAGCTAAQIKFLERRIAFAYPKTIWIRLSVDEPDELEVRFTISQNDLGVVLQQWLTKNSFGRSVFDFRGVTILDLIPLLDFLHAATAGLGARYYLCEAALTPLLSQAHVPVGQIRNDESTLMQELRRPDQLRSRVVPLPENVSSRKLDAALLNYAAKVDLEGCDLVVFDMNDVLRIPFDSASLLTPVVTTIAHKSGALTAFTNMRRRIAHELQRLGALRPVFTYLIGAAEPAPPGLGNWPSTFPMHAFRPDQLTAIRSLAQAACQRILETHGSWLSATSRLPIIPKPVSFELRATLVRSLLRLINELLQNVAQHSQGRGYLMMDLEPAIGLSVYIGDSGIGLAKPLSKRYALPIRTHLSALRYVLDLKRYRDKRRSVAGFTFGGRGLENVGQILSDLRGAITIRTGNAVATFSPYKSRAPLESSAHHYSIQGTHYNIFIPTPSKAGPSD